MLVYRVCSEEEVKYILNNHKIKGVGLLKSYTGANTHNLEDNKRYIYFFIRKKDILYMDPLKGQYVCTYDIPDDILSKCRGIGYYQVYQNEERRLIEVEELAVKSELIDFLYLKKVVLLFKSLDNTDFILDSVNPNLISTVYSDSEELLRARKKEESSS